MAIEYDDIELKISSILKSTKGMDKAIENLKRIGDALEGVNNNGLKETTKDLADFAKALKPIPSSTVKSYQNLAKAMATISAKAKKATEAVADATKPKFQRQSMEELEEIAKRSLGKIQESIPDWEMDWNRDTSWSGELASASQEAQNLKTAMDGVESSAKDAYKELSAYLALYPKTKDSYLKDQMGFDPDVIAHVRQDMYMASEDAKRMAEHLGKSTDNANKMLSPMQKLANRFKSFLQYRAMRAVWSAFVNGAKEGVKNLEDWDRNIGMTGFADSMDRARNSLTILKNSLAVIVAPGLEAISSMLQRIASWAIVAANAISRFFAILGGKSSYRAVKAGVSIADSQSQAAGSAKKATQEFKKQLMAFDEINNISAQNDGGSGGGGGGGVGGGLSDMFEDLPLDNLSKAEEAIRKVGEKVREWNSVFLDANKHIDETSDRFNKFFHIDGLVSKAQGLVAGFNQFVVSKMTSASKTILNEQTKIQQKSDAMNAGIKKGWDTAWNGVKSLVQSVAGFINQQFLKIKADIDFAVTAASLMWDVLSGKKNLAEYKAGMEEAKRQLDQAKQSADNLYNSMNNTFNRKWYVKTVWDEIINRTVHVNEVYEAIGSKGMRTVEKYADGGIVPQGQLFIAREAGAELVGSVGSHTAVMNNQDIVSAVSQGVASAVASVMGGGSNVTVTLEGDAKGLFKVVQKEGRAYSARTGQPALA